LEDLLALDEVSLAVFKDRTMRNMEKLAMCQLSLENLEAATMTMRELFSRSRTALGHDDPRSRLGESRLVTLKNLMSSTASLTSPGKQIMRQQTLAKSEGLKWSNASVDGTCDDVKLADDLNIAAI
jgi:hypothetical protein